MNFPIQSPIAPETLGRKSGVALKIDGNAGAIPPQFQYAIIDDQGAALAQGVNPMTPDQWDTWTDAEDGAYILACVAENLGLTLQAAPVPAARRRRRPQ